MRAAVLALLLSGCVAVTINVQFPQEKIEGAAENIEDLVRTPKAPPSTPAQKQGRLLDGSSWFASIGPRRAEAQGVPELKTRTPEVMAVIESRRARFPELSAAMAKGCIGENNRGLVEARPGQGCPPNVNALVAAENVDRMTLYRTLVQQNNMPAEDIARVQAAFGKVNREKVGAGAWVQLESGDWTRK